MAMTIYTSSDEKWSFAEQATWGTEIGDAANSVGILTEGFGANSIINFRNPQRARDQRYYTLADQQADQKGVVYQTEGMSFPVTTDTIDYFLYSVIQNVTVISLGGSIYNKVFTFPQTQPDFTANAGKFLTMWGITAAGNINQKMWDAIVSELVLSCSPENNEGILWATPTILSRYHDDVSDNIGTVTYPTLSSTTQKYFYDLVQIQIEGNNVILGDAGFTLTIRNNAQKIGIDVTNNVFSSFVLPRYDIELTMSVLWDTNSRASIADAKAGTAKTIELRWLANTVDGHFDITFEGKLQNTVNIDHAIEGNFVTLNFVGGGSFGGTVPLTLITNNQSNRWL